VPLKFLMIRVELYAFRTDIDIPIFKIVVVINMFVQ